MVPAQEYFSFGGGFFLSQSTLRVLDRTVLETVSCELHVKLNNIIGKFVFESLKCIGI